ncbi:MAG: hypothetical protein Q7S40_13415 [Opitutaceae bacterium]|nr:hypothetical protein [Opitutaceae bacterium]
MNKFAISRGAVASSLLVLIVSAADSPKAAPAETVFHDTSGWFPFEFPLDDTNLDSIDLSSLLDAPAGKHGFVTTRPDGHFYFADGKRARFFGTNVVGPGCSPAKDQAPVTAARLAKYGVNLLRFHAFDSPSGKLIDYARGNSQNLNAATLDRLDFFVAELKRRGIYVYIDLLDYRQFNTADGVKDGDAFTRNWAGSMKGASIFDERMIELQKDYATQLLTHRNPYTGLRYVDDPAVAVVETTNENTIFYFFRMAGLSLPSYREELTRRWNRWLVARYPERAALAKAWADSAVRPALLPEEDPAKGTVVLPFGGADRLRPDNPKRALDPLCAEKRITDLYRFFAGIQRHYYKTMTAHLKQIGVRVPITGSNQTFHEVDSQIEAEMGDFISRNQYWRHPDVQSKPPRFANEPMLHVDIPTQRNPLSDIASTSVAGKPQAVAEYNFPWPNEYRSEGWLMSAAYACLQDWDLFLLFSYDAGDKRLGFFKSQSDPARWGEFPAAAMMFHRQDVAPGRNEVHVIHTPEDTYTPRADNRYAKATNYRFLTFVTKVRNVFIDDAYRGNAPLVLAAGPSAGAKVEGKANVIRLSDRPWEKWLYPAFVDAVRKTGVPGYDRMDPAARRLDSDTGELSLDYERGLLTINTPGTKSAIGRLAAAGALELGGMRVDARTEFAAITATSLDGQPIGRSRRVLLTSVARAENTGQGFAPPAKPRTGNSWALPADGRPPVVTEPVRAQVRLAVPGTARVYALDSTGRRTRRLDVQTGDGTIEFNPAGAASIWCEIIVE